MSTITLHHLANKKNNSQWDSLGHPLLKGELPGNENTYFIHPQKRS